MGPTEDPRSRRRLVIAAVIVFALGAALWFGQRSLPGPNADSAGAEDTAREKPRFEGQTKGASDPEIPPTTELPPRRRGGSPEVPSLQPRDSAAPAPPSTLTLPPAEGTPAPERR